MAESIMLIDKPVYHYRVLTSESSSANNKNYDAMFVNYKEIKIFLTGHKRFEQYKCSFYVHQFFDAVFHLNRLNKREQKLFIAKMKHVINEAKQEGITLDSVADLYIPYKVRQVYKWIESGKNPHYKRLKYMALSLYHTSIGLFLWNKLKKIANTRYIKIILRKLLNISNVSQDLIYLEKIYFPTSGKNALILMPFWTDNATCLSVRRICESLHSFGYALHLIVYHDRQVAPADALWDHTYTIRPIGANFGVSYPSRENLIDDWIDNNFLAFVRLLDKNCNFSLCLCNYIFLSKALTCLNNHTKKIINTHDIYSGRNTRLRNADITTYYFSTNKEEEKKALERADYVLAVQKQEQLFFEKLTSKPVITLPYLPQKKYIPYKFVKSPLKVAYIGSYHAPNIVALNKYIKAIKNEKDIILYIGGSISPAIQQDIPNVYVLGRLNDLDEFYSQYDIYINPDTFESGLKIKTVEAMSYGRPFLCTKAASTGIDVEKPYHKAEDIKQMVSFTKQCINNLVLLDEMTKESKRLYDDFYSTYSTDTVLKKILLET
jgi:hypothetical protein